MVIKVLEGYEDQCSGLRHNIHRTELIDLMLIHPMRSTSLPGKAG
jgi:hypothetical protein